jgi:hypothetical protein
MKVCRPRFLIRNRVQSEEYQLRNTRSWVVRNIVSQKKWLTHLGSVRLGDARRMRTAILWIILVRVWVSLMPKISKMGIIELHSLGPNN